MSARTADNARDIPEATVARLPVYLRALTTLVDEGTAMASDFLTGLPTAEAKQRMIVWLAEKGLLAQLQQLWVRNGGAPGAAPLAAAVAMAESHGNTDAVHVNTDGPRAAYAAPTRGQHRGITIAGPAGAPIRAA